MDQIRVLVVDDEAEICEITRSFLTRRSCQVFTAVSAEEAAALLEKERPQIVILDVRLGSSSGMDVLRKAKELDRNIKVIMVTGLGDDESIAQAKSLGADDYITKPFSANFLHGLIVKALAGSGV